MNYIQIEIIDLLIKKKISFSKEYILDVLDFFRVEERVIVDNGDLTASIYTSTEYKEEVNLALEYINKKLSLAFLVEVKYLWPKLKL